MLALGFADGTLLLDDVKATPRRINAHGLRQPSTPAEEFEVPAAGAVLAVAFSPEGTRFVTGGSEATPASGTCKAAACWTPTPPAARPCTRWRCAPAAKICMGEGSPDHAWIAYWELASLNPGHIEHGTASICAMGYGPEGGDLVVITGAGVRRLPEGARRSNLSQMKGYQSMFGFELPERGGASPAQ